MTTNSIVLKTVAVLLFFSIVLTFYAIMNKSNIYKDGWFVPILVAQFWTLVVGINEGNYI